VEGRATLTHDQSGQSEVGQGTLLLADISGYTAFLQAVGEAHAADMARGTFVPEAYPLLTSLLDGIVEALAPPFVLSKLEGDAIFAFGPDGELSIRDQSVVDCLTACYGTYRARLDEARELMICDCNACVSINGLELKFVLHHGGYIVQSVAGQRELFGPDVTISHLLLKNRVVDVIGRSAYALVTDPAVRNLARRPSAIVLPALTCSYERWLRDAWPPTHGGRDRARAKRRRGGALQAAQLRAYLRSFARRRTLSRAGT
jgi:Protein of unknown function (DUF2652)